MSEEEIKKQYANGIVNADEVIKSLIDKFKTDKTSVDVQQLQLIVEYLLYKVDKLQKENEDMREELQMYVDTPINKLIVENEELQKVKEQSQGILSSIKIAYMVHTKDCELLLKDIKKWEKILDK